MEKDPTTWRGMPVDENGYPFESETLTKIIEDNADCCLDTVDKLEDEVVRLRLIIKLARNLVMDIYWHREGLEQNGERLSDVHNLLSAGLEA